MLISFIFGLLIGSFINVLIYRLPRGESFILPPSHCPACQQRLKMWDLIPVLSFLWLEGKCRYCGVSISWRYPLVELLTGLLTVLWWVQFGQSIESVTILVLTYAIIVIAFIDFDHQIIPNIITLPLIVLGVASRAFQGEIVEGLIGCLVGGGILLLIVLLYPKGMGMGDVKFLAMVGVFVGWYQVIWILFIGSIIGSLVMIPLLLFKKIDRKTPFAFGPFLVFATLLIIYGKDWLGVLNIF